MDDQSKYTEDDYLKIEPIEKSDATPNEPNMEKPMQDSVQKAAVNQEESQVKEFSKYICGKCNYKFNRKTISTQSLRCPYCGSDNIEEDKFNLNQTIKEL